LLLVVCRWWWLRQWRLRWRWLRWRLLNPLQLLTAGGGWGFDGVGGDSCRSLAPACKLFACVLGGVCNTQCVLARICGLLCCTVHAVVVVCTHAIHGLHVLQPARAAAPCMTPCAVQCRARHTQRPETRAVLIRACLLAPRVWLVLTCDVQLLEDSGARMSAAACCLTVCT